MKEESERKQEKEIAKRRRELAEEQERTKAADQQRYDSKLRDLYAEMGALEGAAIEKAIKEEEESISQRKAAFEVQLASELAALKREIAQSTEQSVKEIRQTVLPPERFVAQEVASPEFAAKKALEETRHNTEMQRIQSQMASSAGNSTAIDRERT